MLLSNQTNRRRTRASAQTRASGSRATAGGPATAGRARRLALRAGLLGLPLLLAAGGAPASATQLFNNTNIYGVNNGPPSPTIVSLPTVQLTQIVTYHWNGGRGAAPGSITLRDSTCHNYGPFAVHATSGQGSAPNVNWIADVNVRMPAGNYAVLDSSPSTWSYNAASHNWGFTVLNGNVLANAPVNFTPYPTRCLTFSAGPATGTPVVNPTPVVFPGRGSTPITPVAMLPPPCPNSHGVNPYIAAPVCAGPAGSMITLVVGQRLPAPISGVVFGPGPIGRGLYGGIGALMAVPSTVLSKPPVPVSIPVTAAIGSTYRIPVPPGLCVSPGRNWAWDVVLLHPGGALQGDIGTFIATGC